MNVQPDPPVVEMMVELACRAPSVHNSQPWKWSYADGYVDLHTDRTRLLRTIDPTGRQLTISCGAALDHLEKAATTFKWATEVELLPSRNSPDHLARVHFVRGAHPQSHEFDLLTAINRRHSDRRPFGTLSGSRIDTPQMREAAERCDTRLTVVSPEGRQTLAAASRLSAGVRKYDATYQAEMRWWAGHAFASEGIPSNSLAPHMESSNAELGRQFPEPRAAATSTSSIDDESAVVLLSTNSDLRLDWVNCGRALSSYLLEATVGGLSTCPLTHMTEQSGSRALVKSLAPDSGVPQVLIRIGTKPEGAVQKATPRRLVSSVLTIDGGRATNRRGPLPR